MTQVPPAVPESTPHPVVPVCYRHPKRETYVRCTRCARPICPECMHEASVGHQCPECVADGRRTQRSARTVFGGTLSGAKGYVTKTLVGINVLVMIISISMAGGRGLFGGGFGGLLGGSTPLMTGGAVVGQTRYVETQTGAELLGPYGVADGEFYRLVTAMFLHYGLFHLAMNMYALWILGGALESALGSVRFLVLYLVAGLGGNVAIYLFTPFGFGAGASTAIFGLFAALFIVFRRLGRDTSSLIPLLVINIAISFLPGISLTGHLGGLVTGAVVAFTLAYAPAKARTAIVAATVVGLLAVMSVAVFLQTAHLQTQGFTPL